MGKRIVIALGGNALGNNYQEQREAVRNTARAIVDLAAEGHEVIVAHGNGPQVGMIQKAMTALHKQEPDKYTLCPLSICCAMSQGYIGHDLQIAIRDELTRRGIAKEVSTVLTHVVVDQADPAFQNPTKPIGTYVSREEADRLIAERGFTYAEDAGRGLRRVVPSPQPGTPAGACAGWCPPPSPPPLWSCPPFVTWYRRDRWSSPAVAAVFQ